MQANVVLGRLEMDGYKGKLAAAQAELVAAQGAVAAATERAAASEVARAVAEEARAAAERRREETEAESQVGVRVIRVLCWTTTKVNEIVWY